MFGFGKKKKQDVNGKAGKKKSKLDKLVMGAIVGGAVGSVIGMSIAPQKGKDTREIIAQKGKEFIKKGQESLEKIAETEKELRRETQSKKNLLSRIADSILGRGKGKKVKKEIMKDEEMKKIPNEIE